MRQWPSQCVCVYGVRKRRERSVVSREGYRGGRKQGRGDGAGRGLYQRRVEMRKALWRLAGCRETKRLQALDHGLGKGGMSGSWADVEWTASAVHETARTSCTTASRGRWA